jgi:hypothetical protein
MHSSCKAFHLIFSKGADHCIYTVHRTLCVMRGGDIRSSVPHALASHTRSHAQILGGAPDRLTSHDLPTIYVGLQAPTSLPLALSEGHAPSRIGRSAYMYVCTVCVCADIRLKSLIATKCMFTRLYAGVEPALGYRGTDKPFGMFGSIHGTRPNTNLFLVV